MNRQHPLDDAFRSKLEGLSTGTPTHLWERIDQKRSWKHRFFNYLRQYRSFAVVLASIPIAGIALLLWHSQQPALAAFPVSETNRQPQIASHVAALPSTQETIAPYSSAPATASNSFPDTAVGGAQPGPDLQKTAYFPVLSQRVKRVGAEKQADRLVQPMASAALNAAKKLISTSASGRFLPKPAHEPALPAIAAVHEKEKRPILPALFNTDPKCAQFGNGGWGLYLDIMASPDLAFSDLQARSPNFEDYAESRRETESFVFAFSGGVRLSLEAENGLALRTGINYSQVNERFTYFNGTERREITEPVRNNQGDIIGYDTIVTIGERYKVSRNTYRMLDIPFIVGYGIKAGDFGVAVNGGAYLNLLFRQSGDFLSPETLTPVSLNPEGPDSGSVFKRQAGVGYYGSLSLTYATKSGLEILIEPHFKIFPNSVTQTNM